MDVGYAEDWTLDDWLSYGLQQSSDMMDVDTSPEDELGSDVLSTATFVDNQNMDTYLQTLASPNMDFQLPPETNSIDNLYLTNINSRNSAEALVDNPMHSANNPQSLEDNFIENFANLDIANYCRRDSAVHIVSGDYPLNYYLNHVYYNA
jgi:hypothetical protein